jgi:hypothetical protein
VDPIYEVTFLKLVGQLEQRLLLAHILKAAENGKKYKMYSKNCC